MAPINPFNRIKIQDEQDYFRVSIKNFLNLPNKPQRFYDAINELSQIREALLVLQAGNLLPQLSGHNFYYNALRWLQLNNPITDGVSVSQIASYDDINDAIADSFFQYVQWFKNNYLVNNSLYQQAQIQLGREKVERRNQLDLQASKLEDEFRESLKKSQEELSRAINQQKESLNEELNQRFTSQSDQIRGTGQIVVEEIQQIQSLETWYDHYQQNIKLYERKLYGQKWQNLYTLGRLSNLFKEIKNRINNSVLHFRANKEEWIVDRALYILKGIIFFILYILNKSITWSFLFIKQLKVWLWSKIICLTIQRWAWFILLATALIGQAYVVFLVTSNSHIENILGVHIQTIVSKDLVFAKLSAFLGFILVPSLGYAAANKNYRIYSNLLEQYRHRATVARTLQGVLRHIDEGENNKDIRQNLAAVAALAMFEMKAVGHLTKSDSGSLPAGEVLRSIFNSGK